MELTPKKQIEKAKNAFEKEACMLKGFYPCCPELEKIYARYRAVLAEIVLKADDKLSRQEKLTYLIGDQYHEQRKKIIKEMIETENIDPNKIIYHDCHLFNECYFQKDDQFARYLLAHGASTKSLWEGRNTDTGKVIRFINKIINQQND